MECQTGDPHRERRSAAVQGVTQDRVPQGGQVDPYLVCPAGTRFRLHQGDRAEPGHGTDDGDSRLAGGVRRQGGSRLTGPRTADGSLDQDLPGEVAEHQGVVATGHGVGAELPLQVAGRHGCAGQQQCPRCVQIKPVNHQGRNRPLGKARQGRCGPAEDRVVFLVCGWVDQQPGWFVGHQDAVVGVEQGQGRDPNTRPQPGEVGVVRDSGAFPNQHSGIGHHFAVDKDVAVLNLLAGAGIRTSQDLLGKTGQPAGTMGLDHRNRVLQLWPVRMAGVAEGTT